MLELGSPFDTYTNTNTGERLSTGSKSNFGGIRSSAKTPTNNQNSFSFELKYWREKNLLYLLKPDSESNDTLRYFFCGKIFLDTIFLKFSFRSSTSENE